MALKQLLNEEHFDKFIHIFKNELKNDHTNEISKYYTRRFIHCKSHEMDIALNILCRDTTFIHIIINDNETKLENTKYKMRLNKICSYKLLTYILKNYLKQYIIDYKLLDHQDGYDRIVNSVFGIKHLKMDILSEEDYIEYLNKYKYNELTSPLNKTIYDDILHKTVKEFNTLYNKIMNSQKKIVRWYRQQKINRQTRLLLTSYYRLNKRKLQLPTEIICNKILKINY
jgi:hypothetical protein